METILDPKHWATTHLGFHYLYSPEVSVSFHQYPLHLSIFGHLIFRAEFVLLQKWVTMRS